MSANPIDSFIPEDIRTLHEIHDYRNAAQVLATGCPEEFHEIIDAPSAFRLSLADIRKPGGNESKIPKRVSGLLRAKGWMETRIEGDLLITKVAGSGGKVPGLEDDGEGDGGDALDGIVSRSIWNGTARIRRSIVISMLSARSMSAIRSTRRFFWRAALRSIRFSKNWVRSWIATEIPGSTAKAGPDSSSPNTAPARHGWASCRTG
nr:BglII/BstYI family type II restriction endonuclease [Methylococcus capsulatus]